MLFEYCIWIASQITRITTINYFVNYLKSLSTIFTWYFGMHLEFLQRWQMKCLHFCRTHSTEHYTFKHLKTFPGIPPQIHPPQGLSPKWLYQHSWSFGFHLIGLRRIISKTLFNHFYRNKRKFFPNILHKFLKVPRET